MEIIINTDTKGIQINGEFVPDAELAIEEILEKLVSNNYTKSFKRYNFRNLIGINKIGNEMVYRFILDDGIKWLNLSSNFIDRMTRELNQNTIFKSKTQYDEELEKLVKPKKIEETIRNAMSENGGLLKTYQPEYFVEVVVESKKISKISGGIIRLDNNVSYNKSLKIFNEIPDYFNIHIVPSHTFGSGKLCTPLEENAVRIQDIYKLTHRTVWNSEFSTDLFGDIDAIVVFTYIAHLVAIGEFDKSKYLDLIEYYYEPIKL